MSNIENILFRCVIYLYVKNIINVRIMIVSDILMYIVRLLDEVIISIYLVIII